MLTINELYGRLAKDTSQQRSLFTGKFTGLTNIELQLSGSATGKAHFAIYEESGNGELTPVKEQSVTKGEGISYSPPDPNSIVSFYVNYYDGDDLPDARAIIT